MADKKSLASKITQAIGEDLYSVSIGVDGAEKVQIHDSGTNSEGNFTLQDFWNNWKDFRNTANFIYWGAPPNLRPGVDPLATLNSQGTSYLENVKIWYNPDW